MFPLQLLIEFSIELPLLVFYVTILTCILIQICRKNPKFTTGFFAIYVFQSFVDIGGYTFSTLMIRLPRTGVLPKGFVSAPWSIITLSLNGYCLCFQLTAHAFIAYNRYTALNNPSQHRWLWKGRRLQKILLLLLILPLPGVGFKPFSRIEVVESGQGYALLWFPQWTYAYNSLVLIVYGVASCVVSSTLEIATLVAYRRMSARTKKEVRDDFKLLLYAMFQFVGQSLLTIYSVLIIYATFTDDTNMITITQASFSYIVDILSLSGPVCLFATSQIVRRSYRRCYHLDRERTPSVIYVTRLSS